MLLHMHKKINGEIIEISDNDRIFFTEIVSLYKPVVKTYKSDGSKEISANISVADYQVKYIENMKGLDNYIQTVSSYTTMTLGVPLKNEGLIKTAKDYRNGDDCIYRGKEHFKYYNDIHPQKQHEYSIYYLDVDYDDFAPLHFQMDTAEEVRNTLIKLIPVLEFVSMCIFPSSSANIINSITGENRSQGNSWRVLFFVANSTTKSNDNFREYICRRAWRDDVNLGYIKSTKGNAVVMRLYVDLAVTSPERIIAIAKVITEYPYEKIEKDATIYKGGILDLNSIDINVEEDYRPKFEQKKSLVTNKNPSISKKYNSKVSTNIRPTTDNEMIIISEEDKQRVITIYSYLQSTKMHDVSILKYQLNDSLVSAFLIFLGFEVDSNFKFKIRDENTASVSINYNGFIKDFGGTFSGNLISFIMEVYNLEFIDSWKYIRNCFGENLTLSNETMVSLPDAKSFEKRLTTNKQQGKNYEF